MNAAEFHLIVIVVVVEKRIKNARRLDGDWKHKYKKHKNEQEK